jgi:2-amino-4-hydroxy-6-hydroxymethyldihydropteridine diphosphokinase
MATITIALGSNIGDRKKHLSSAKSFLAEYSEDKLLTSSIYITEPVGPSERDFYNAVVQLKSSKQPNEALSAFKKYEQEHGRAPSAPRWSKRTIDLDIITWGDLVIQSDNLIIPHPEYHRRLFVLHPLKEIQPQFRDPKTGKKISDLISHAPSMRVQKTDLSW